MTKSSSSSNSSSELSQEVREEGQDGEHQMQQVAQGQQQHLQSQQQPATPDQKQAANKSKRNPFCSRCRNHGMSALVKGHKRHCEYRDCQCEGCQLVEQRQRISAAQIKLRREQKQDEESGRPIKVSPPVRIINSTTTTTTTRSGGSAAIASAVAAAAAAAAAATTTRPTEPKRLFTGQHQYPHLNLNLNLNRAESEQLQQANQHHHQQQHHLQHHQQQHHNQQQQQAVAAAALSNVALQNLAKFPNCMLSTISHHHHNHWQQQQQQHSPVTPTLAGPLTPTPLPVSLTGTTTTPTTTTSEVKPADQINLVKRIHEEFGPLAIYAWLKSENFNAYKVLNLIEMTRSSFDEVLQLNGRSPLDLTDLIVD